MKKVLIAAFALGLIACSTTNDSPTLSSGEQGEKTPILQTNLATANLNIEGMTCEYGCAKMIESKLAELDGISSCKVNFKETLATIEYDKTLLDERMIVSMIGEINKGQYKVVKE